MITPRRWIQVKTIAKFLGASSGPQKPWTIITTAMINITARITVDGKTAKVRMRLKGDITDHLQGDKWSFRIKVNGDNTIWGMRRFSLQAPERSGWGHEWVMYQWFRKEGLISLRYDFIDLTLNGRRLGIFALEESFSKELIEHNRRREGPILKWDESLLFDHRKNEVGYKVEETELFHAADVISFTTPKCLPIQSCGTIFSRAGTCWWR